MNRCLLSKNRCRARSGASGTGFEPCAAPGRPLGKTWGGLWLSWGLALGFFGVFGCSPASEAPADAQPRPVAQVRILRVEAEEARGREEALGTVRARLRATLEAKVSGRIRRMPIRVGEEVTAGQVVAALEVDEIQARLRQAEARRGQTRRDLERYSTLLKKNAVTRQQFDQVSAAHEVAQANVAEARSMLAYATVRAPFGGIVMHKLAEVGDLASPGRPLVEIADPTTLRLEVAVPDALSRFVGVGSRLPVHISALDEPLEATVSEVAPATDPNSRTLTVKLDLPPHPYLRAGQFGRAHIPTGRMQILRLPAAAIRQRGQLELIFVVEEGTARLRLVRTGKRFGDEVEVVSGLEAGESVVLDGPSDLLDGQKVEAAS